MAAVGQSAIDSGVDAGAVFAEGTCGFDELGDAAALGACAPAVEELADSAGIQVAGEDFAQRFFELVGAPKHSTAAFHFP